jgi:hypothetical protein
MALPELAREDARQHLRTFGQGIVARAETERPASFRHETRFELDGVDPIRDRLIKNAARMALGSPCKKIGEGFGAFLRPAVPDTHDRPPMLPQYNDPGAPLFPRIFTARLASAGLPLHSRRGRPAAARLLLSGIAAQWSHRPGSMRCQAGRRAFHGREDAMTAVPFAIGQRVVERATGLAMDVFSIRRREVYCTWGTGPYRVLRVLPAEQVHAARPALCGRQTAANDA